jgi:hypothetical protein
LSNVVCKRAEKAYGLQQQIVNVLLLHMELHGMNDLIANRLRTGRFVGLHLCDLDL